MAIRLIDQCHYIKHPDVLGLVLCTFERCTGTGHIRCCGGCNEARARRAMKLLEHMVHRDKSCCTNQATHQDTDNTCTYALL